MPGLYKSQLWPAWRKEEGGQSQTMESAKQFTQRRYQVTVNLFHLHRGQQKKPVAHTKWVYTHLILSMPHCRGCELLPFCFLAAFCERTRKEAGRARRYPPASFVPRDQLGRTWEERDWPTFQAKSGKVSPTEQTGFSPFPFVTGYHPNQVTAVPETCPNPTLGRGTRFFNPHYLARGEVGGGGIPVACQI